jgi:hypothetical protein
MGILKEEQPGVAAKVLMEIVLTQDIVTVGVLQEFKNRINQEK